MAYNNLVTENASLGHKNNRAMETVRYNPVTGLTDKVPSVPLDKALSTTSTNPVENRAIAESVIECINGISRNKYNIEQNANEISNTNARIDFNITAIESNTQDIQTLNNKVATNTSDIAANATAIENCNNSIAANATAIEQNTADIEQNTAAIVRNAIAIKKNADDIAEINTDIGDLTELTNTVRRHTTEISELTTMTVDNTSAITAEITRASNAEQANTTAISDEVTRATAAEQQLASDISNKQNTLVSGTNIKTINSTSLLDEGNLSLDATSLNMDNTASTPTSISNALSDKQPKELSASISVGGAAQTTVEGCLSALASSSGPASLSVYPDYDRLDFGGGYSNVTKYTSYTSLGAGTYLLYISMDLDVSDTSNILARIKITCPNTFDDVGSITFTAYNNSSDSLGYHKIVPCTPMLVRVTGTTNHRLTFVLDTDYRSSSSYRYWRVYRRYIKLA